MSPEKGLSGFDENMENTSGFTLREKMQSDIDDVEARLGDTDISNNERKKLAKRLNMLTNMQESLLKEGKNGNGGKSEGEATVKKDKENGNGNSNEATPESWYKNRRDIIISTYAPLKISYNKGKD